MATKDDKKANDSHYDTKTCTKDHDDIPVKRLGKLHTKQAGPLRHRCAACAYEAGVQDGVRMVTEQIEAEKKEAKVGARKPRQLPKVVPNHDHNNSNGDGNGDAPPTAF